MRIFDKLRRLSGVLCLLGCSGPHSDDGSDTDGPRDCPEVTVSVDPSQRLNELSSDQVQELCSWYEQEWMCAVTKAELCRGEALKAGGASASDADGGVAACEQAEAACLAGEPAFYENLSSCREVNNLTQCSASFADYQKCLTDTLLPAQGSQVNVYGCDELEQYAAKQDSEDWVAPASCSAVFETCTLN